MHKEKTYTSAHRQDIIEHQTKQIGYAKCKEWWDAESTVQLKRGPWWLLLSLRSSPLINRSLLNSYLDHDHFLAGPHRFVLNIFITYRMVLGGPILKLSSFIRLSLLDMYLDHQHFLGGPVEWICTWISVTYKVVLVGYVLRSSAFLRWSCKMDLYLDLCLL